MGRHPKPLALHLADGNRSRLSESRIDSIRAAELKLGAPKLRAPKRVKNDSVAAAEWRRIVKMYREAKLDCVTDADLRLLESFVLAYSRLETLRGYRDADIDLTSVVDAQTFGSLVRIATDLDDNILKHERLLKELAARLELDPVARLSRVAKARQREAEDPVGLTMFGD